MEIFVWNMAISFVLLFMIISSVIFAFLNEKSFKYYALYCLFLLLYILTGNDFYYFGLKPFSAQYLGAENADILFSILDSLLQSIFYTLYVIFVLHFLDLDKRKRKFFKKLIRFIRISWLSLFTVGIVCYFLKNSDLFSNLFTIIYLPSVIAIFVVSIFKVYKKAGNHKYYFLFGSISFICFTIFAFVANITPSLHIESPITFFYLGVSIETIFFSLGLAHKMKVLNDDKNQIRRVVAHHRYNQNLSKMQGLLEGEEKEKKRIAQELHDGIAGDLSAIKYNLSFLESTQMDSESKDIINQVTQIINQSGVQLREISHNLSPSSILNYGLILSVEEFCKKIEHTYKIGVDFQFEGESITFLTSTQMHIYRIIQELVNNIVKHSEANSASVQITHYPPNLTVRIIDNGRGFSGKKVSNGIGLSNIDSRVRILNADLKKEKTSIGSSFFLSINTNKITVMDYRNK